MDDMDMMAAMGFAGFGKQQKKKKPTVDQSSFVRDKRVRETIQNDSIVDILLNRTNRMYLLSIV